MRLKGVELSALRMGEWENGRMRDGDEMRDEVRATTE
jgi:hypothetical protein